MYFSLQIFLPVRNGINQMSLNTDNEIKANLKYKDIKKHASMNEQKEKV